MTGGDQSIKYTWESNHQQILQAFQMVHQNMDAMLQKINQVSATQRRQNEEHATGWQKVTSEIGRSFAALTGFGSLMGGIYTTVSMIREEWGKVIAAQQKYRETRTQSGVSFGEMNVLARLDDPSVAGGVSTMTQLQALKKQTKRKALLTEDEINQVYADTLSARGDFTVRGMDEFVRASGGLLPGNVEGIKTLSARGMDVSKVTGEKDAKKIVSWLMEVQAASRATKIQDLTENMLTPVLTMMAKGASAEQAGEFFAGLTQITGDAQPEKSRTASIRFMQELDEFVPERGAKDKRGRPLRITKQMIDEYEAAHEQSPQAMIGVLQKYPDLGEAFLTKGGSFGKGAMMPAFEGLVRGDEKVMSQFRSAEAKIGALGNAEAMAAYDERVRVLRTDKVMQTFLAEREKLIGEEEKALDDRFASDAMASQVRELFRNTLAEHDINGPDMIHDRLRMIDFEYGLSQGSDPILHARFELNRLKGQSNDPQKGYAQINHALDTLDRMEARYRPGDTLRNARNLDRNSRGPQGGNP